MPVGAKQNLYSTMKLPQTPHAHILPSLVTCGLLAWANSAWCGGVVTTFTPAALQTALAGGGTVTFAGSGTITLSSSLSITQDTTIEVGGHQVTLSGGGAVRLFQVTNANFRLHGLTLADGRVLGAPGAVASSAGQDAAGGCLLNQGGTISFTACTLTNHSVQGGNAGTNSSGTYVGAAGKGLGGALCSFGGQINLTNCLIENCGAGGGWGTSNGLACGGALYLDGSGLNLQGTTVQSNGITGGPGQSWPAADAFGGAIYAINNAWLWASNSVFTGNAAYGGVGSAGSGNGNGGALCLAGTAQGTFDQCVFAANFVTSLAPAPLSPAGSDFGGAVFNQGEFRAANSSFSRNRVLGAGGGAGARAGAGGALYSTGTVRLNACTFDSNLAHGGDGYYHSVLQNFAGGPGEGGAIWSAGLLAATNSTWTANQALGGHFPMPSAGNDGPAHGGALCVAAGTATLVQVTLAGNAAAVDPGSYSGIYVDLSGGNLCNQSGSVAMWNSILANGTARVTTYYGTVMTCASNVWGTLTDGGYNLSSDTTGSFTAPGSCLSTDPMLSALGNHGGPTPTMWLLPGSPARDQVPAGFPATDQRGAPRPQGPAADIGAVEADDPPAAPFTVVPTSAGGSLTLSFAATDSWRAYRLLGSSDLVTWTSLATNSPLSAGPLQFAQPLSGPKGFYRVVTP
jgi:hypothetical protein